MRYREKSRDGGWQGGPMCYMERGVGSRTLAALFSLCCVAASLGGGNVVQAKDVYKRQDQSFAKKYGFQVVDTAAGGYELLALSFDGTAPRFTDAARRGTIPEQELTIYYGMQCPYIHTSLEQVKRFCGERGCLLYTSRCV